MTSKMEELEQEIRDLKDEIKRYATQLQAIVVDSSDSVDLKKEKEKDRLSGLITGRGETLNLLLTLLLEGNKAVNQVAGASVGESLP